jgi:two-component system LytT family response regulator
MYSTIVVDDEVAQQELMVSILGKYFPQFRVMCCCRSVEEGAQKIIEHQPQLVMLDISMGDGTGFDLLNQIDVRNFDVIFCTSHNDYALNAFRVAAVDYLLKPVDKEHLEIALSRFEEKMRNRQTVNNLDLLMQNYHSMSADKARIVLPTQTGMVVMDINKIVRCESDNAYTTFYFTDNTKMLTSTSIKECEQMLTQYDFFRIHNSHVVNLRCVKEYVKGDGGYVKMTDGSTADVSRHRKEEFLRALRKG